MNRIKRWAGILWMLIALAALYYLVQTAHAEIAKKPVIDTRIQWSVFVIVFIPIAVGMMIFGWYALKGEYDQLPKSSTDIED
jgi:hypothetical protein